MKEIIGTIVSPKGFYADGIHCGVKKRKKYRRSWLVVL